MKLSAFELRTALETSIEFVPKSSPSREQRLRERLPKLDPSEIATALVEAQQVVATAEGLVREFRAGQRDEESIEPALRERYPWLAPEAVPPHRWLWIFSRPAEDLSTRVRAYAYYLHMM
jgi:hypothetical protein